MLLNFGNRLDFVQLFQGSASGIEKTEDNWENGDRNTLVNYLHAETNQLLLLVQT